MKTVIFRLFDTIPISIWFNVLFLCIKKTWPFNEYIVVKKISYSIKTENQHLKTYYENKTFTNIIEYKE